MTYKELFEKIKTFNQNDLNKDVTVYDKNTDEFFRVTNFGRIDESHSDILQFGHPFIVIGE